MTARTRAIERKLEDWFRRSGVTIVERNANGDAIIHGPQIAVGVFSTTAWGYGEFHYETMISLADLATAIELGEIS